MWIHQAFYDDARRYYDLLYEKHQQRVALFNDLVRWKGERIYRFKFGNCDMVLKMEEIDHVKDNVKHEYAVGLQLNELRYEYPNFVPTIKYLKGNPPIKKKDLPPCSYSTKYNVPYIVVAHEEGETVSVDMPLREQLYIFLQIYAAVQVAYLKYGFTHYNLHRGNVIYRQIDASKPIKYPGFAIGSPVLAIMIDFGRSYTNQNGGRHYPSRMVYKEPNFHHDILNYIFSSMMLKHREAAYDIMKFLGYTKITGDLNSTIRNNKGNKIIKSSSLAMYLKDKYNLNIITEPTDKVMTPIKQDFKIIGSKFRMHLQEDHERYFRKEIDKLIDSRPV